MTNERIPEPSDKFEDEGLASPRAEMPSKAITGDPQDDMPVPGDRPIASVDYGTTAEEERAGEPLDLKLSREEPDLLTRADQMPDDSESAATPYPEDREERVGRIVETDEGARSDDEPDAVAYDVGTDSGGFTAEERAMRIEREV